MKISQAVVYAVHATLKLARADPRQPVPCNELAGDGEMPERFLLQIMRTLVLGGVVSSKRGHTGGFSIARAPDEITLLEIVEAVDDHLHSEIPDLEGLPLYAQKRLGKTLQKTANSARRELQKVTLSQLLKPNDRRTARHSAAAAIRSSIRP
jgi:Rrf2 family protein